MPPTRYEYKPDEDLELPDEMEVDLAGQEVEPDHEQPDAAVSTSDNEPIVEPDKAKPWADEVASMQSELNTLRGFIANQFSQLRQTQQESRPQPQQDPYAQQQQGYAQQGWVDPAVQEYNQLRETVSNLQRQHQQLEHSAATTARMAQRAALDKVVSQYPDLHDFIPKNDLDLAFNKLIADKKFGVNYEQELVTEYQKRAFQKYYEKSRTTADELEGKRQERQSKSVKAAAQVAPGGSVYQRQQQPKPNPRDRSYRSAREGMLRDLEASG